MHDRKKGFIAFSFAIIFVLGLFFPVSYSAAAEDKKMIFKHPLKFASCLPPTHVIVRGEKELVRKMEEASNGRVKIQFYGGQSLGKISTQYELLLDGVADIGGTVAIGYAPDKFPLTKFVDLPFTFNGAEVGTRVFWKLYDMGLKDEYKDLKMLTYWSCAPSQAYSRKKRMDKFEDFKGMRFFAAGSMYDMFKQLGATPIKVGMAEVYTSLQRGVIDGATGALFPTAKVWKWTDLCKYALKCNMSSYGSFIAMNKDVWNKIPPDMQVAWEKAGREVSIQIAKGYDADEKEGLELWKASGSEVVDLPKEEQKKMAEKMLPIWQKWIDENEAAGRSAKELYKNYVKVMKEMGQPVIMKLPGLYEN